MCTIFIYVCSIIMIIVIIIYKLLQYGIIKITYFSLYILTACEVRCDACARSGASKR